MRKLSLFLFSITLFVIPVLYSPRFLFADSVKRDALLIAFGLLVAIGPARQALRGNGWPFPIGKTPWLALIGFAAVSLAWARSPALGFEALLTLLLGFAIVSVTLDALNYANQEGLDGARFVYLPLLLACGATCAYGVLQSLGFDIPDLPYNSRKFPVSTFGNTNHSSEFCAPLVAAAFLLATTDRRVWGRIGLVVLFVTSLYLGTIYVRAGLIAAGLSLLITFLYLKSRFTGAKWLHLLIPVAAAVIAFRMPSFREGPESVERDIAKQNSAAVRELVYFHALPSMIGARPVWGWGIGQFQVEFPRFRSPEEIQLSSNGVNLTMLEEPHNDYLLYASELGFIGAALLAAFAWSFARSWKWSSMSLGASMAFCAIAAIGINALFRSPLTNPSSMMVFWVMVALFSYETSRNSKCSAATGKKIAWASFPMAIFFIAWGGMKLGSEMQLSEFFQSGRKDIQLLEKAAALDPLDPKKLEVLGVYQKQSMADLSAARSSFEKLLALQPNHYNARVVLALILIDQGNLNAAVEEIQKAQALNPKSPLANLKELGRQEEILGLHKQKNQIAGFEVHFTKAKQFYDLHLKMHPEDADTWMALGQLFQNDGDDVEAKRSWAQAHRLYGIDHLRNKKPDDAAKQFRLFQKFAPKDEVNPNLYLASAALAKQDRETAKELLKSLGEKNVSQSALRQPGLETLLMDPELRELLKP